MTQVLLISGYNYRTNQHIVYYFVLFILRTATALEITITPDDDNNNNFDSLLLNCLTNFSLSRLSLSIEWDEHQN